jgi:hypothetical protein
VPQDPDTHPILYIFIQSRFNNKQAMLALK